MNRVKMKSWVDTVLVVVAILLLALLLWKPVFNFFKLRQDVSSAGLSLAGIVLTDGVGYEEMGRLPAPNKKYDLVWFRENGGATVSYTYSLALVEPEGKFDMKSAFCRSGDDFVQATWVDETTLEVEASSTDFYKQEHQVEVDGVTVVIRYK